MNTDRLQLWRVYLRVVEMGSFSAVARELNSTQPRISRQIAQLEAQLGVRLLRRSTRTLSMTDEGEQLYADARRILADVDETEGRLRGSRGQARGLIRVACPTTLSRLKLLPMMRGFLDRYPELQVEFSVSDRFVDLIAEGIDVAIRGGEISDTELHARRIGTVRRVCVAAPSYLRASGTPETPANLVKHQCVTYTLLATGTVWPFAGQPVRVSGRVRGDSPDVILEMVRSGYGVGLMPSWLFRDALAAGELLRILKDWPVPDLPIYAIYQARRQVPLRVRLLVDYLSEMFSEDSDLAC